LKQTIWNLRKPTHHLSKNMRARLFGGDDIMTVEVDDKEYLVIMCHNSLNGWILIPRQAETRVFINLANDRSYKSRFHIQRAK